MRLWYVQAGQAGQRLDQALTSLLPGLGLRGRRRLLENGRVLLNGRPALAACRVREGDRLELADTLPAESSPAGLTAGARLLARQGDYAFFFKPAGMHSVALAGSTAPSLEACLPGLLAESSPQAMDNAASGRTHEPMEPDRGGAVLLQRLDRGTSGIVCAALTGRAAQGFRDMERTGQAEKLYVALLCGVLDGPRCVRFGLDTARRRKSRLLPEQGDPSRWTEFWPLNCWQGADAAAVLAALGWGKVSPDAGEATGASSMTLAACRIRRGARHQIRAHAASLGLPLWGDALYGCPASEPDTTKFFLHHGLLRFPGASCAVLPAWSLPPEAHAALKKLFEI
ncbi:MAG: RNA pseudouridine synthase [Desulfovibrio sp.]|nr:RNA pseudouridine synthase [Desulfovibrio sp.]